MPSLLKTAFLQLNKWAGNEYPKREDFVSDNEKIDAALQTHNTQLAQMEKSYTEVFARATNLTGQQIIDIGFNPRVIIIKAVLKINDNYECIGSMSGHTGVQSRLFKYVSGGVQSGVGSIIELHSGTGYNAATCIINGDNTITLDWTKGGTDLPSDDIGVILTAF